MGQVGRDVRSNVAREGVGRRNARSSFEGGQHDPLAAVVVGLLYQLHEPAPTARSTSLTAGLGFPTRLLIAICCDVPSVVERLFMNAGIKVNCFIRRTNIVER